MKRSSPRLWAAVFALALPVTASAAPVRLPDGLREDFAGYSIFVSIRDVKSLLPKGDSAQTPEQRAPKDADYLEAGKVIAKYKHILAGLMRHYLKEQTTYRAARKFVRRKGTPGPVSRLSLGGYFAPAPDPSRTHVIASAPELWIHLDPAKAGKWDWLDIKIQSEFMGSLALLGESIRKEALTAIGGVGKLDYYFTGGVSPFGEVPVFLELLKTAPDALSGTPRRIREVLEQLRQGSKGPIGKAWLAEILTKPSSEAEGLIQWLALTTPDGQWKAQYPALMEADHAIAKRGVGTYVDGILWAINRSGLYQE